MENQLDSFESMHLKQLGIHSIEQLYEICSTKDVNLGKIDVSKLTVKQLNTLMSLNSYSLIFYINDDSDLIMTTSFRDQKNERQTKFKNHWITMHIDFLFGKIDGTQE